MTFLVVFVTYPNDSFYEMYSRFSLLVHRQGANALTKTGMDLAFEALACVMDVPNYDQICSERSTGSCSVTGATGFFGHNVTEYESRVNSDEDVARALSSATYSDGVPVMRSNIFGNADSADNDEDLTYTNFFLIIVDLPTEDESSDILTFESEAIDRANAMQTKLLSNKEGYRLEYNSDRSTGDELQRSASKDLPLIAVAFLVMMGYIAIILGSCKDRVRSQSLVGLGAVTAIVLSMLAGYGISFLFGVPLTNVALVLPFVLVGIGLDDTFILTGEYSLTNPNDSYYDRFGAMIVKGGAAITVTTTTNVLAFALGSSSSIPAISWFCTYAVLSIFFGYIMQITYVTAIMYLDEFRIEKEKYDCCVCFTAKNYAGNKEHLAEEGEKNKAREWIGIYTDWILRPTSKVVILVAFAALLVTSIVGAQYVKEDFDPLSLLPPDSYVLDFVNTREDLNNENDAITVGVYFRGLNPANSDEADAMDSFLKDIEDLEYVRDPAQLYWLDSFREYVNAVNEVNPLFENLTFEEQLDEFLRNETFTLAFGDNIVRDSKTGEVTSSRTYVRFLGIGTDALKGVDALDAQLEVTKNQPLNDGREISGDWQLFTYSDSYFNWEFFAVIKPNLIQTIFLGLVSVFAVTLFALPDPRMALVVFVTVMAIDIELIALIPAAGLNIDPITFLSLTMAIGLVVDYCAHIVHAYLEAPKPPGTTRNEIVRTVMTEIGVSILTGAFSTFLGTCILGFSKSNTFLTIFKMMMGIVCLGAGHGFIFMPVVLSLIGPLKNPGDMGKPESAELARKSMRILIPLDEIEALKEEEEEKVVIDANHSKEGTE